MKKLMALAILGSASAALACAGGLDFHLGAGYHSSYIGDPVSYAGSFSQSQVMAMPMGIGAYIGVGYGFGERKAFSLGGEFATSWDFAIEPPGASNFAFQGRAYMKFNVGDVVTLTGFGGFGGNAAGSFQDTMSLVGNPVAGVRITVFFIYAEYAAVLPPSFDGIEKHEVGIGFSFFK